LYVGNKNYSSWSLRAWLPLRWAAIAFEEQCIPLNQPGYGQGKIAQVLAVSPSGQVPALHVDGCVIWETLAIAEWAAERAPQAKLWPDEACRRARARAVACEMHAGFAALRRDLPMNIHRRCAAQDWPSATRDNLARIDRLWSDLRAEFAAQGPHLFGRRGIVDAFFTPVATRLRTYGVDLSPAANAYRDTLLADADFQEWERAAEPDSWDQHGYSVIDGMYR
jgi:glutathione S-transferase